MFGRRCLGWLCWRRPRRCCCDRWRWHGSRHGRLGHRLGYSWSRCRQWWCHDSADWRRPNTIKVGTFGGKGTPAGLAFLPGRNAVRGFSSDCLPVWPSRWLRQRRLSWNRSRIEIPAQAIERDESNLAYRVELVHVALVEQDSQVLHGDVDIHRFQLPRLKLRALVAVEGQITKPLERHGIICGRLAVLGRRRHRGEEFYFGGDLGLMAQKLHLTQVHWRVELKADLLWVLAVASRLPAAGLRRRRQQLGDRILWVF
mmetsp:Transcript_9741/g.25197  ORF Transcript_9741/g.25197 Transcript_9741/m.25197 type:complete len:257 (-) Transcript_9741:53-823(-)